MLELQFLVMDTENVDGRLSLGIDFLTNFASRQTLTEWLLRGNISVAPLTAPSFSILEFDSLTYLSFISKKKDFDRRIHPAFACWKLSKS